MADHTARPDRERGARVVRRWSLIPAMFVCLLALALSRRSASPPRRTPARPPSSTGAGPTGATSPVRTSFASRPGHTFAMSLTREVGTAQNIGFAFGRMQADILAGAPNASPSPSLAPSATPTHAPTPATTPAPSVPGMPNTSGGAAASMLPQSWPTIAGIGLLGVVLVALLAPRRRDIEPRITADTGLV